MSLTEQLDELDQQYYENEEEEAENCVAALKKLHQSVLKRPEDLATFRQKAPQVCGGNYLPYLVWMELAKILDGEKGRDQLIEYLKAFVLSDFGEELQQKMKPLLAVFYAYDRQFEIDRVNAAALRDAHPMVLEYFQRMQQFATQNKAAVKAYYEKLQLLKGYFPNFDLFDLPVPELEEYLESIQEV